ncbi:MAG: glycosyltransferase [Desulfovibrio sp.]|jgi:glycosyltransferase involved in cell wall biosynthesis|nr:glycosyltransferase [Desulfovibrio sp.]
MRDMRIFYHLSRYISHRLAGLAYIDVLRGLGHEVRANLPSGFDAASPVAAVTAPSDGLSREQAAFLESADIVILHQEPTRYASIYEAIPVLSRKYVIAYAVWENEKLTPFFIPPLRMVNEVWTCSEFCRAAMVPHVQRCFVLPHLARRLSPAAGDLRWAGDLFAESREAGAFVFLSVMDAVNPRKNLRGLLTAFGLVRDGARRPVRLLLKQYRAKMPFDGMPGVISVAEDVSPGRMAALYALCGAYVSAHHAEGWGLGMSEAMTYGKPVIATGYSGNMEYMDATNSFPVPYVLEPVSEEMRALLPLFTPDMLWAEPDMGRFVKAMRAVAGGRHDPGLNARAAAIVERFGPARVGAILTELLDRAANVQVARQGVAGKRPVIPSPSQRLKPDASK